MYCVKCRTKREASNPEQVTMKNGRKALRGTCPNCGTKFHKWGHKQTWNKDSHGLKAGVFWGAWHTVLIGWDVFLDHGEGLGADRLGKVSIRPETVSPEEFLELWKLFSEDMAWTTFHVLYHLGDSFCRLYLDQHMDVVRHDLQLFDPPRVHSACLVKDILQSDGYFALKHSSSILWQKYQVIHQPMPRVSAGPILQRHEDSMPRTRLHPQSGETGVLCANKIYLKCYLLFVFPLFPAPNQNLAFQK